jgi:hypothetical protein
VADAAGGDPHVVLGPGAPTALRNRRQAAPFARHGWVVRDDRSAIDPRVEACSRARSPAANFCPLGQLGHGHERKPEPGSARVAVYPGRGTALLQQRSDVRVDDHVAHGATPPRSCATPEGRSGRHRVPRPTTRCRRRGRLDPRPSGHPVSARVRRSSTVATLGPAPRRAARSHSQASRRQGTEGRGAAISAYSIME